MAMSRAAVTLAASLNNECACLSDLARWEQGLAVIEEAVAIRRTLVQALPEAYLSKLVGSLNQLAEVLGAWNREAEADAAWTVPAPVDTRLSELTAEPDGSFSARVAFDEAAEYVIFPGLRVERREDGRFHARPARRAQFGNAQLAPGDDQATDHCPLRTAAKPGPTDLGTYWAQPAAASRERP
jgi:hypothetical protein